MYINKKIDLRGSVPPYITSELFNNHLNKKERHGLTNSLSTNNIYVLPHSTRQFGKDIKNTMHLTVIPDVLQQNLNIEEKIKYYKKINEDLTNMLNNYDKNFFENKKNSKFIHKIINGNERDILHKKSNEKNLIPCTRNEKRRYEKNIIDKENKDNNISYFENNHEKEKEKLIKKNKTHMDIMVNREMIYGGINNKIENHRKEEINKENKDNNTIIGKKSTLKNNNNILKEINVKEEKIPKKHLYNYGNINNINNPQEVNEYFEDIFHDMQIRENYILIDPNYLKNNQKFINHKMRAILIDWLVDVHKKYKLKPETLYLTTNIIDRYLSKRENIETKNLQLLGVVSLLISSKYEDIHPPPVKELALITDGAYVVNQLISMENEILSCLNFDLFYPTQWHFLECYKKKLNMNEITFYFAWYLMEISLLNINIINYRGSIIASSAVMISLKLFKKFNEKEFENITGYKQKNLENCEKEIKSISKEKNKNLSAVRRKFLSGKYYEVSKIEVENIE